MTTTTAASTFTLATKTAIPRAARRMPLSPTLDVRAARDAYLAENGFDTASYTAETFEVEAFGRKRTYRNTADRKWAIPLHDLHHAATGFGTDLIGEAEVGAFELTGGCRTFTVYALNTIAVVTGLLVAPLRTMRAFRDARGASALYRQGADYDALLELSLGELRAKLGIPKGGLAHTPRRLHDEAERLRSDALPGAPSLGAVGVALALAYALGAGIVGVTQIARGAVVLGAIVAALGAALAISAFSARKGALGARALVGHSVLGIATASVVVALSSSPLAALGVAPAIVILVMLARG